MRNAVGRGRPGTEGLPANRIWKRDRDLSNEGRNGHEAVEETACEHCMAMQSSLSFMCGPDGRTRKVKYEKFRQPCGVQPEACWEALKSGRLKVGEAEYPTTMNQTRSHMAGEEGCSGSCKTPVIALERKIVQVLMEVLVEEDWIWWNAEKNRPPSPGK